jgi:hypothetical protein
LSVGGLDGCADGEAVGMDVRTLDLGLDIVDGVGRLHLKGDSLTRDCADVSMPAERPYLVSFSTHGS